MPSSFRDSAPDSPPPPDAINVDSSSSELSLSDAIFSENALARGEKNAGERLTTRRFSPFLMATIPALLLGLGVAFQYSMRDAHDEMSISTSGISGGGLARNVVWDAAQTFVVAPKMSSDSVIWHARLQADGHGVTGRAPIDGQITRVWVREGQSVQVGDRVLRIASSARALPEAPMPSRASRRAENAQIEASQEQNRLQSKMERAQQQLAAAQERVALAKKRIAQTSEIVRRLREGASEELPEESGTAVVSNSAASNAVVSNAVAPDSTPQNEYSNSDNSANSEAQKTAIQARAVSLRESQDAARHAEKAEDTARKAEHVADSAESDARSLAQKARQMREKYDREVAAREDAAHENAAHENAAQNEKDEPLARANDASNSATPKPTSKATVRPLKKLTVSLNAVSSAEARAKSAADEASSKRDSARKARAAAIEAKSVARAASEKAVRALKQTLVLGEESGTETRRKTVSRPMRGAGRKVENLPSISEAARLVRAATEESASAQRDASRLKATVDEYAQQAKSTQQDLSYSSSALETAQQSAQQDSLDRTLTANLSVMRAPSSGVVLWVAPVTQTVNSGDPIVRMSGRGALTARFVDYSGRWRTLKPDTVLPASLAPIASHAAAPWKTGAAKFASTAKTFVSSTRSLTAPLSNAPKTPKNGATNSLNVNSAGASAKNATPLLPAPAILARVESVTPPTRAGEPAIVRMAVFAAPDAAAVSSARRDTSALHRARRLRLNAGMTVFCALGKAGVLQESTLESAPVEVPASAVLLDDVSLSDKTNVGAAPDNVSPNVSAQGEVRAPKMLSPNTPAPNTPAPNTPAPNTPANSENAGPTPNVVAPNAFVPNSSASNSNGTTFPQPSLPTLPTSAGSTANSNSAIKKSALESVGLVAVLKPFGIERELHRVEWRRVRFSAIPSGVRRVISGLQPGERVALQPSILRAFAQSNGYDATVRLRNEL